MEPQNTRKEGIYRYRTGHLRRLVRANRIEVPINRPKEFL
jgi:hypothetical protein